MSGAAKCDNCGTYADWSGGYHYDYLAAPAGWIDVRFTAAPRATTQPDGGQFCRYECVAAFFAKRAAELRVSVRPKAADPS